MFRFSRSKILFLLIVWFWVWGICPWDASSQAAQIGEAAHADHGHQEADDIHHASKGAEHSCAGAGVYNSNEDLLKIGWHPLHAVSSLNLPFGADRAAQPFRADRLLSSLLERMVLPKLLTEYYRLYSVYRI
ncbi:MAG: hypothetical protein WAO55_04410 [Candidatus Manganitrophaceae bacterium]